MFLPSLNLPSLNVSRWGRGLAPASSVNQMRLGSARKRLFPTLGHFKLEWQGLNCLPVSKSTPLKPGVKETCSTSLIAIRQSKITTMDGVLIIDKPAGLTSHDVVNRVRHLMGTRRVGHTGTLDPFATGVLVVLVGRATRLSQFLMGLDKEYEAIIRLGYSTDTGDATGKRLEGSTSTRRVTSAEIEAAMETLRGDIDQVPPMYSAKKQGGRKLYELARAGKEVERKPVRVRIHRFEALQSTGELIKDNLDGTYDFEARIQCSSGTYIRTLAEEIGKRLNVGAHLAELRRTRVGDFALDEARTLDRIKMNIAEEAVGKTLLPLDKAVAQLPYVDLSAGDVVRISHGLTVQPPDAGTFSSGVYVRLRDPHGNLVAIGEFMAADQSLHPKVVFTPHE